MTLVIWGAFVLAVLALLALDLGVFNRRPHEISVAEALGWTAFWVGLALAFNVVVFWLYENDWIGAGLAFPGDVGGRTAALEFLTGYLLEKSLSLDNIFVIALIFSYFRVPLAYQHRVLFWGVVGALALRGLMIGAGAALLHRFAWMTYVFGVLLLVTAARMLVARHDNLAPEENLAVRAARRWIPVTADFDGTRFFTRRDGVFVATPLLLVLIMVETTDVMFAVDSIPAIFAVTDDPFIVYTSNVFAILGLRSLYFALAPMLARFRYLKTSLVFVLAYIGVKMLLAHSHPIPASVSLALVAGILGVGLLASLMGGVNDTAALRPPVTPGQLGPTTLTVAWKAVILVVGGTVLALGTAMIVLPGPALLVIPLGLAILATQFLWAHRLLERVRARIHRWVLLVTVLALHGAPVIGLGEVGPAAMGVSLAAVRPSLAAMGPSLLDPPSWLHASSGTSGFAAGDGAPAAGAGVGRTASRPGVSPGLRAGPILTAGLTRITLRRHLDFRAAQALVRAGYPSWRTTAPPPLPFV